MNSFHQQAAENCRHCAETKHVYPADYHGAILAILQSEPPGQRSKFAGKVMGACHNCFKNLPVTRATPLADALIKNP